MGKLDFMAFADRLSSPALFAVAHHWNRVRGERRAPRWEDFSPSALAPHFKLLWGFHYDARNGTFTGRLAGAHIKEWLGANFWGARLDDIHPPHVLHEARIFLTTVVSTPAAGRCSGALFKMGETIIQGERIALPIAADGMNADGVLGASDYPHLRVSGSIELIHEHMEWLVL